MNGSLWQAWAPNFDFLSSLHQHYFSFLLSYLRPVFTDIDIDIFYWTVLAFMCRQISHLSHVFKKPGNVAVN